MQKLDQLPLWVIEEVIYSIKLYNGITRERKSVNLEMDEFWGQVTLTQIKNALQRTLNFMIILFLYSY